MNEMMIPGFLPIDKKQYRGVPVVTFRDIDAIHQRPEGSARFRFRDNRKHFIEGTDYYISDGGRISPTPMGEIPKGTILLTQTGYLMIVKSFTDDLSWAIQRELVNGYFSARRQGYSFMGTPVITIPEYCAATGERRDTARDRLRRRIGDFHMGEALLLEGANLALFKRTNPEFRSAAKAIWVLTAAGARKLQALRGKQIGTIKD